MLDTHTIAKIRGEYDNDYRPICVLASNYNVNRKTIYDVVKHEGAYEDALDAKRIALIQSEYEEDGMSIRAISRLNHCSQEKVFRIVNRLGIYAADMEQKQEANPRTTPSARPTA